MLPEAVVAGFIAICLAIFFSVNLHSILRGRRRGKQATPVKVYAEVESPSGLAINAAAMGTLIFFVETLMFLFLAFTGNASTLYAAPFRLLTPFDSAVQTFGLALTGFGYFLFVWSVVARGRYATSWAMPENQRLVTWGPYRYVRHPSYLAYFLMFFGLFFTWQNLAALLPLLAIPGYVQVSKREEELLTSRFSDEYRQYQRATGKFFPRLAKKNGD